MGCAPALPGWWDSIVPAIFDLTWFSKVALSFAESLSRELSAPSNEE